MFRWLAVLVVLAMMVACSQVASGSSSEDEDVVESSSAKKDSSSSSKGSDSAGSSEEADEECVGEPGKAWDGTTAKDFACGSGTKLSPYIILTAEQLAKLSFIVGANEKEYQGKYYKLGADILLNEGKIIDDKGALVADSSKLHKWTPIGNSGVAFDGTFDGEGHTISGMFINTTSSHNGLFGNSRGTIQNLTLSNAWVYGGKYTGGIVGSSIGSVENLTNLASVSGKENCVGGVLGNSSQKQYQHNSFIKNATNHGIVVGNKNVGGIAGCATAVTVDGVENTASIEGYGYVGGIFGGIGAYTTNDIKNLKNSGIIIGSHFVGGISGHCGGSSLNINTYQETSSYNCSNSTAWTCGILTQAENTAAISGKYFVGGILGIACGGKISSLGNRANIVGEYDAAGIAGSVSYSNSKNLYNTGDISGIIKSAGIFAYNEEGVTSSAYSTGKVDGDSLVGLMIGYNYNTTMADYYYLEQGELEPFGLNNSGGVATPKTENEMKSEEFAELLGEDFVYESKVNDGYPVLKWETEGDEE